MSNETSPNADTGGRYEPNDAFSYRSTTGHWVTWVRNDQGEWWANDDRGAAASDADVDFNRQTDDAVYAPAVTRHPYPGGRCPHGSESICPYCEPRRFKRAYVQAQALLEHRVTLTEIEAEDILDRVPPIGRNETP